tara:strand:- start:48 stop:638 length:591 start_codon:yes stop_codon:yes gene_type:complete
MNVHPIFSSPICEIDIKEDLTRLNSIKDYKFINTTSTGSSNSFNTENLSVLDKFPQEKANLFFHFLKYKNEVLKFNSTEFRITTSWGTKTLPNGYSQFHNHTNSVYSCVFYFDDVSGGNIEFTTTNNSFQLNAPSEVNILNLRNFFITPRKNLLLIFPSYLLHRVAENNSEQTRYSLAFNIFPTGSIFAGDSSITL